MPALMVLHQQGSQSSGFCRMFDILNFKSAPTHVIPKMQFFKNHLTLPSRAICRDLFTLGTRLFYSHVFIQIASLLFQNPQPVVRKS